MAVLILVATGIAAFGLYKAFCLYRDLQRNIVLAKSSGLPVVVSPFDLLSIFWLTTYKLWTPLFKNLLPQSMQGLWLDLLHPEWAFFHGHVPFEKLGMDVFIVASPTRLSVFVADAEAVNQITTRRTDFPKPLDMYGALNIYGMNLISTEGAGWRMHRKLVAPSFGEKNNELVFRETLHHARSLMRLWAGADGQGNQTVTDPSLAAMDFALFVISSAGFDVRVVWPHEEGEGVIDPRTEDGSMKVGSDIPIGHKMNYREALSKLLHNIMWTQIIPPRWLHKSPIKLHRTIGQAVDEWGMYMNELYEIKRRQAASGENQGGMDLFGALIRGSGIVDETSSTQVTKSDLQGNAFVLMVAGHETTANALHFSLIFLAMHRDSQQRLQEDLDKIFGGQSTTQWKYDEHFPKLFASMAAAVMNETLRLMSPVLNIPKSTAPGRPQPLTLRGKQYMVPGDAHVFITAAIHRNPKYWPPPPCGASKTNGIPDVDSFRPERWLVESDPSDSFVDISYDDEELRGPSGEDTSAQLFKPVKGSYIPFSDGFRSCIGRRFAQVEILAVLAAIFTQYSVELAVDDFATDDAVERMPRGGAERTAVYEKAIHRAKDYLKNKAETIVTLQLRGVSIPIRLMRRGEERFCV